MSNSISNLYIPSIRSIDEFIGNDGWSLPQFNPHQFDHLQEQVLNNLIYFQSNYGIIFIPLLFLILFIRPIALVVDLAIVALLLLGFVYSTRQNNTVLDDRPILILSLLLIAAFMIIRILGTVVVFLMAIALPLTLMLVHATLRTSKSADKQKKIGEEISSDPTPMGLLLSCLGSKISMKEN